MIIETRAVRFDSITLDSGATLAPVEVAYETYGQLNAAKSNAILMLHAFSGDAHAAGISPETGKPGWWDNIDRPRQGVRHQQVLRHLLERAGRLPRHHRALVHQPRHRPPLRHVVSGDHHRRHGARCRRC